MRNLQTFIDALRQNLNLAVGSEDGNSQTASNPERLPFDAALPRWLQEQHGTNARKAERWRRMGTPCLSPELAYGRHRGPDQRNSRKAAVAVTVLFDEQHDHWIPLTRRPTRLQHHGGQISFPGGKIERGETAEQAATREFEEELGRLPPGMSMVGLLPHQYVYASNNWVTPVVFIAQPPLFPWKPEPTEVAEVLECPITSIVDPELTTTHRQRPIRGPHGEESGMLAFRAPAYRCQNHEIWGATAIILSQLARILPSS
ncbi:MAG: CoA pyrophosphatase [Planctomycetota bacterium]